MSIPERFQIEASSRPQGIKPNVEDTWKALEKAGLYVVDKDQHLGAPFGARYCVGARITPSAADKQTTLLHVSVCEYISAELAKMGREHSEQMMKVIPNRSVHANKQLTLTVREEEKTPAADDALEKAKAVFGSL